MIQLYRWERSTAARVMVIVGGLAFVLFSIGCMNLSFGGRHDYASSSSSTENEVSQKGTAYVRAGSDVSVYYPASFQSPPNLQFTDNASRDGITILEQAADHFRVKNMQSSGLNVAWEARGVKAAPSAAPTTSTNNPAPTTTVTVDRSTRNP